MEKYQLSVNDLPVYLKKNYNLTTKKSMTNKIHSRPPFTAQNQTRKSEMKANLSNSLIIKESNQNKSNSLVKNGVDKSKAVAKKNGFNIIDVTTSLEMNKKIIN